MRSYSIRSYNGKEYFGSNLILSNVNNRAELIYESEETNISVSDDYPFLALAKLRKELDPLNIKLLCNGARLDVYPSSALLIGIKAYQLEFGKPGFATKKWTNN